MNHYEILEVQSSASQSEIKAAYRSLVKRYHPDINPDLSASSRMILINEAYEILSSVTSRNLYDLYLQGVPVKTEIQSRPEQRYREAYKSKRVKQDRERIIFLIKLKSRFYKYERYANLFFFVVGFLFTVDYYFQFKQTEEVVKEVRDTRFETRIITKEGTNVSVTKSFFTEFTHNGVSTVKIKYSFLFNSPAKIQAVGISSDFPISGTIYIFRNVFSLIILIFSSIILKNKEYSDFRLSSGLIPGFITLFLLIFLITEMT